MATLSLAIIKTRPNKDGSFGIKIAVASRGTTVFMPTRFKVENLKQWKDGRVVKNPEADYINTQLRKLLREYDEILDSMPNPEVPASEVRKYIECVSNRADSLKAYTERYIERLRKEGRKSYMKNMQGTLGHLVDCLGETVTLQQMNPAALSKFEKHLRKIGHSDTSINIRMTHLKAILNSAVNDGTVEYKIFPFRNYNMPAVAVRDINISRSEFQTLLNAEFKGVSARRYTVARDLFMLSFYCAGINMTDLMDATLDGDTLTFIRKKTERKKHGEKTVSMTIQPEARAIIDKYITPKGKLDFGYNYTEYEAFRSFVSKSLNRIGEELGFEKKFMYYSARKTFVQFGTELGIPLYILEYAIGQTIKEANNRPIFNYIGTMRRLADLAVRTIADYAVEPEIEGDEPLPEWARRRVTASRTS